MKKIIFAAALFVAFSSASFADTSVKKAKKVKRAKTEVVVKDLRCASIFVEVANIYLSPPYNYGWYDAATMGNRAEKACKALASSEN